MSHKKLKLFSGLLSVTALASMTGVPALAIEVPKGSFSLTNTVDESLNGEGNSEDASSAFLGEDVLSDYRTGNPSNDVYTGNGGFLQKGLPLVAKQEAVTDQEIALKAGSEDTLAEDDTIVGIGAPFAEDPAARTVEEYNAAVLPEMLIAFNSVNAPFTGVGENQAVTSFAMDSERPKASEGELVVASPNVYLNIHSDPSLGSEVVGKMYGNDIAVRLLRVDERWSRIRSGNVVGYVMNEYLIDGEEARTLSDIAVQQVASAGDGENRSVYQEANDTSKVFTEVKEGDQYEVTGSEDGWLGIMTEDGEGYIPASEMTLSMAYPVAESSRKEADRISRSNVKERADHEQRKADKADAVAEVAQARAESASEADEESAMAVVEVALRAADAAAAQADVAKVAVSQAGEESGQAVIEFATQYIGNPYVWGGSSLTHGADCSGFVMAVYGNFGFRLPHYDVSDRSVGSPVPSLEEARAGDIVCYNGHVALYMGDGMIVHAQDEQHGITTSRANFMHIVCIRRLFN